MSQYAAKTTKKKCSHQSATIALFLLTTCVVACGGGSDNGSPAPTVMDSSLESDIVASATPLPAMSTTTDDGAPVVVKGTYLGADVAIASPDDPDGFHSRATIKGHGNSISRVWKRSRIA